MDEIGVVVKGGGNSPKIRKSFVKTAEGLCKRILKRDEDKKVRRVSLTGAKDERCKIEEERKKTR